MAAVWIIAALAVVGGGAYVVSKNGAKVETENAKATTTVDMKAETSLKDLFGKNVMCTFDVTQGEMRSRGTAYITGENMRVDSTTTQGDKLVVDSHMIKVGTDAYVWSSMGAGAGQGAKIKVTADMEAETKDKLAVDWDQKMDYDCDDWNPDQGKFSVPTSINFVDLSAMFKANASGEVNKCGACDMVADANAKAQCKAALNCK